MSAYGAIKVQAPKEPLRVRSYPLAGGLSITTHPVTGSDTDSELIDYLFDVFNDELAGAYLSATLLTHRGKDLSSTRADDTRRVRELLFRGNDNSRHTPSHPRIR